VLEDFLEKIKKLTPIQNYKKNFKYSPFKKNIDYKILKETKILHQKKKDLSKIQIIEFSILFLIKNYLHLFSKKIEVLSELEFFSKKNQEFKNEIISLFLEGKNIDAVNSQIEKNFFDIIAEISNNSNIQIISNNKKDHEIEELLNDLIQDHINQTNLKRIATLEQKLIKNLDENSYTELVKLKSQLNGE